MKLISVCAGFAGFMSSLYSTINVDTNDITTTTTQQPTTATTATTKKKGEEVRKSNEKKPTTTNPTTEAMKTRANRDRVVAEQVPALVDFSARCAPCARYTPPC